MEVHITSSDATQSVYHIPPLLSPNIFDTQHNWQSDTTTGFHHADASANLWCEDNYPHLTEPSSSTDAHVLGGGVALSNRSVPEIVVQESLTHDLPKCQEARLKQMKHLHKCDLCGQLCSRSSDLKRHRLKHVGPKLVCPVEGCSRRFSRKDKHKYHITHGHRPKRVNTIKQYTCSNCDQVFKWPSHLAKHELSHLSRFDRPHKCDKWDWTFTERKDLARHIESVHSYAPGYYICGVKDCNYWWSVPEEKGFVRKDHIVRHLRAVHTVIFPEDPHHLGQLLFEHWCLWIKL